MKTAIVYRANEALDGKLSGLRSKVDYFIRFESEEFKGGINSYEFIKFVQSLFSVKMRAEKELKVFTDLTCAPALVGLGGLEEGYFTVNILCQEDGQLEEWVRMIADEDKEVVIVLENLADHCNVDGVDPYSLNSEDRNPGGSYHKKVLSIWEEGLRMRGVQYRTVHFCTFEALWKLGTKDNIVFVCDHHRARCVRHLEEHTGWRNSYRANPSSLVKLEDLKIF